MAEWSGGEKLGIRLISVSWGWGLTIKDCHSVYWLDYCAIHYTVPPKTIKTVQLSTTSLCCESHMINIQIYAALHRSVMIWDNIFQRFICRIFYRFVASIKIEIALQQIQDLLATKLRRGATKNTVKFGTMSHLDPLNS